MTQSSPQKKSSAKLFISLAVVAAFIAAGVFIAIPQWEKQQALEIQEAITSQPGEPKVGSVIVSFWDRSVSVSDFQCAYSSAPGASYTVALSNLTASDVDVFTLISQWISGSKTQEAVPAEKSVLTLVLESGVLTMADAVAVKDITITTDIKPILPTDPPAIKQKVTLKEFTLTGLRANTAVVAEALKGKDENEQFKALLNFTAKEASLAGYDVSMDVGLGTPVRLTLDSMQAKDMGMLKSGPSTASNLKFSAMGKDILTVGSLSSEYMAIPDILTPLRSIPARPQDPQAELEKLSAAIQEVFEKELEVVIIKVPVLN